MSDHSLSLQDAAGMGRLCGGPAVETVEIAIADDHAIFRDALRALLETEPGFRVVGDAGDGAEALELVRRLDPDVLLLDVGMPTVPGLEVVRELASSRVRVVLVAAHLRQSEVVEAFRRGACGVLPKSAPTALLFKCIRAVASGQYWVEERDVGRLVEALRADGAGSAPAAPGRPCLTRREAEIVSAVVAGDANKDIARRFAISEQTVKHHLTSVYDKLGVGGRLELALYVMQHRLLDQSLRK